MASFKAEQLHRAVVDELKIRLASAMPVLTETVDANGDKVATFSADATPATGEKVVVIRTKAHTTGVKDSLGLATPEFGPHIIQFCIETGLIATSNYLAPADIGNIVWTIGSKGAICEWYQSANTNVPSTSLMTAGNLKLQFGPLWHGITAAS